MQYYGKMKIILIRKFLNAYKCKRLGNYQTVYVKNLGLSRKKTQNTQKQKKSFGFAFGCFT